MAFDAALKAEEVSGESESEKSDEEEEEREMEPELERELQTNIEEVDEFVEADSDMSDVVCSFTYLYMCLFLMTSQRKINHHFLYFIYYNKK